VRGITDLMVMPGLINLDFADVRSVMGEMGKAMMGTGEAEGEAPRARRRREGDRQPAARRRVDEGREGRAHLDHRRRAT
jgi:cell division GTPase FtsZ